MGRTERDSSPSERTPRPSEPGQYWEAIVTDWEPTLAHSLWRAHSDAVNLELLARWLPAQPGAKILKTDLFDETVAEGLYPALAVDGAHVVGVDVAPATVRGATYRYPKLEAHVADVRNLPFETGSFDAVVSNSTLDHFDSLEPLILGARELCRVIRPGGRLIITLDNRQNPIVALRTSISFRLMHRLGIVPYYVGRTCGRRRLVSILKTCDMDVKETTAVMHCPPKLAGGLAERRAGGSALSDEARARYLERVLRFERLGSSPVRYLTGHFVAALAVKPENN